MTLLATWHLIGPILLHNNILRGSEPVQKVAYLDLTETHTRKAETHDSNDDVCELGDVWKEAWWESLVG